MKKLQGLNVVVLESRHGKTMGELVAVQGGNPVLAPSMQEIPLENNTQALDFGKNLLSGEIDVMILLTGVGTRALMSVLETKFPREAILEAFGKIPVVPRGPKPIRVLNEWKIPYALTVPEPNTWKDLIETLDQNTAKVSLKGKRVAVQEYGVSNEPLLAALKERGADVRTVPVYRWALPDNIEPLKTAILLIADKKADVVMFTTSVQVDHLFQVAKSLGVEAELRRGFQSTVIASVGPDCSENLRNFGLEPDIEPESPKMGPLVVETAAKARDILAVKKKSPDCATEVRDAILKFASETEQIQDSVFLKACRCEKTPYTPVWLMRQAGRYMKHYRSIREKNGFLDICKNKDLVTEITVTAQETLNADAAIIFADILLLVESLGLGLEFMKGDGPSIKNKIRTPADIEKLPYVNPRESLSYVMNAIRQTRRALKKDVPLIGFAGAPFTLLSYMIEGGPSETFEETRKLMKADLSQWNMLMEKVSRVTAEYLRAQVEAGVQAVQLFDSWVGCLTREEFEKYVLPHLAQVVKAVQGRTPVIYFGTKTESFLDQISRAGADVISVDHRVDIADAWKKIGPAKAIQGNLDPKILCGDWKSVESAVKKILDTVGGRPGHVFNLGHGILPETPEENVISLVKFIQSYSARS